MSWELIALLVVAALPALIVLQALVAKWEKRMVWPYGELQSQPHFGDPSGYGTGCLQEAAQSGWQFLGWAPDLKGEMYRVSYAMLLAPECDGLAIIGVGQVLNFQVAGTWLHSLARDDCGPDGSFTSTVSGNFGSGTELGWAASASRCWPSPRKPPSSNSGATAKRAATNSPGADLLLTPTRSRSTGVTPGVAPSRWR